MEDKPTEVSTEHMLLPSSSSRVGCGFGEGPCPLSTALFEFSTLDQGLGEPQVAWLGGSLAVTDCKAQVLLWLHPKEMPKPLVLCVFIT